LQVDDLQQPLLPACSRRKTLLVPDQGTLGVDPPGRLTQEVGPVITVVLYVQQARRVPGDRFLRLQPLVELGVSLRPDMVSAETVQPIPVGEEITC